MSLELALKSSISSLSVNQQALGLISQNISNANSEDFARREISQKNNVIGGIPAGVKIAEVRRVVDSFLVESSRRQISNVGSTAVTSDYYNKLQLFLGQPGSENSINTSVDDFFSSLADLTDNPEQTFFRSNVIDKSIRLTDQVSSLAQNVESLRFDIDQDISSTVRDINNLLDNLNDINRAVKETANVGGDVNATLDERQAALSDLSELIEFRITEQNSGEISIFMGGNELLSQSSRVHFQYSAQTSADSFIVGVPSAPIELIALDSSGNPTANKTTIVSSTGDTIQKNEITSGTLKGLIDLKDTEFPKVLAQLDEFASSVTDSINAIHNDGGGFPPASELIGTKSVVGTDVRNYSGNVMFAILDPNGNPVSDQFGLGLPPLNLDLGRLDGGSGTGTSDINDIIKEINHYFGPPPSQKASIGDIDNIQLAAISSSITSVEAAGTINFVDNPAIGDTITVDGTVFTFIAGASSGTNIQVQATASDTAVEISRYLNTYTGGTVDDVTYSVVGSTLTITHDTSGIAGNAFTIAVDLSGSGGTASINGAGAIPAPSSTLISGADASGSLEVDFEMTNLAGSDYTFEVLGLAIDNGATGMSNSFDPYAVKSGVRERSGKDGVANDTLVIDLTGSTLGEGGVHTVAIDVRVTAADGTISTDTIDFEFTIPDPAGDIKNDRFAATAISGAGDATLTAPTGGDRFLTASFINESGAVANASEVGHLKIISNKPDDYRIVIQELDSQDKGLISDSASATNQGFSHFFGLNNFFDSGADLKNSAINFKVQDKYIENTSLISAGRLVQSNQSADPNANPILTYSLGLGSNQNISDMANLRNSRISFAAAGKLPTIDTTIVGYSAEIISSVSFDAKRVDDENKQQVILFDAFNDRLQAQSGVNVDEELANTIIFQNNYQASARMITVVSELFDTLLQTF